MCYVIGVASSGKVLYFLLLCVFGGAEQLCFCCVSSVSSNVGNSVLLAHGSIIQVSMVDTYKSIRTQASNIYQN